MRGSKLARLCVRAEFALFQFAWVVETDLISVWGIELDLISVSGSELTLFMCGCKVLGFSFWFEN